MKMITRTVQKHVISVAEITIENGELKAIPLGTIEVNNETMTQEKALKRAQKIHGKDKQLAITDIKTTEIQYGMPFEEFMKNAICLNEGGAE